MNSRISLMNTQSSLPELASAYQSPRVDAQESARFAPYKRLHRRLRGRYPLVIPLAMIGLAFGSIYGWHKALPVYRAEGLMHVANSLPKVMTDTDQNEQLPMYEEFVESQVLLMSSRQVVAITLADPAFRKVLGKRPMSIELFVASLLADHLPRTQSINVTFTDVDPDVATQAVKSLINSFLTAYGENDNSEEQRRLTVLNQRKTTLALEMDDVRKQIGLVPSPDVLSIAMIDGTMRDLLKDRGALQTDQENFQARFGSSNAAVKGIQSRLAQLDKQIGMYRNEFTAMQAATAVSPQTQRHVATLPEYLGYQEKLDGLRADEEETVHRIDQLNTEASLHQGRFNLAGNVVAPSAPYADRRLRFAATFGLAGALLPVCAFLLLGMVDRRFYHSEDATDLSDLPLLGVLPTLPDRNNHGDLARIAAYCVHKLRLRLQLLSRGRNKPVYMITSSIAGEGKTSLTLALGMAYAASGKRTLLIDGDPIGRGLSRRLHLDDQLGLLDSFEGARFTLAQPLAMNVSVMPAGHGGEGKIATGFGWEELEWLLSEGREQYDVILIDTGPVLSSLQAPVVAQVADYVILTVSSGLKDSLAKQSLRLFRAIDIPLAGCVFNRACARDYNRWIGGDSYYTQASTNRPQRFHNGNAPYGPLAASINASHGERVETGA